MHWGVKHSNIWKFMEPNLLNGNIIVVIVWLSDKLKTGKWSSLRPSSQWSLSEKFPSYKGLYGCYINKRVRLTWFKCCYTWWLIYYFRTEESRNCPLTRSQTSLWIYLWICIHVLVCDPGYRVGGGGDRGVASREADLTAQTRTQSLFTRFWGERRLGIRLRRAWFHGKVLLFFLRTFPWDPARLNLTSNLLSPQKRINSDWVRVCLLPAGVFDHQYRLAVA